VAVLAAGAAILLWSLDILGTRRLSRTCGWLGVGVGLLLGVGVLLGWLHLDVRGIILATALQAVWIVPVALQLQRIPAGADP
jgi:hypothetical protein